MAAVLLIAVSWAAPHVPVAVGDTIVSGILTGSHTWTLNGTPYRVVDDLTIAANGTLQIEPGVEVIVSPGKVIAVLGSMSTGGGADPGGAPFVWFHGDNATPPSEWVGIELHQYGYVYLVGAIVNDAQVGVRVLQDAPGTNQGGLHVQSSLIEYNTVGVDLSSTSYNYIINTSLSYNSLYGLNGTLGNMIIDNVIEDNEIGVLFGESWSGGFGNAWFSENEVRGNTVIGMDVTADSGSGTLQCNEFAGNGRSPNLGFGLRIQSQNLSGLVINHNNFLDNAIQAEDAGSNQWSNENAGNFWSDYNGTDANGDGFGDTPYAVDADTQDDFPYIAPLDIHNDCPPAGPPVDKGVAPPTDLWAELTGANLDDLEFTWSPSADDGAGEDDVVGYDLYCSDVYDSDGAGYALEASLPTGSSSHTIAGAGHGDPSNRFCFLRATDDEGNTADSGQAGKFTELLPAGMRLVSFPLVQSDTDVTRVFQTVDYVRLIRYDKEAGMARNWRTYDTRKPTGDFTDADHTMAIWMEVLTDSWFTVAGQVPVVTQIPLGTGWNFVGYPSLIDRTVSDALAGIDYQRVEAYAPQGPWHLRKMADSEVFSAGNGYWIHVSTGTVWAVEN